MIEVIVKKIKVTRIIILKFEKPSEKTLKQC